ncbi:hypothetical protein AQUCO_02500026v1 [Aquilegia coerulea]|uniref:F-box domain-containing protein n=1 Tax=Aquilegia coerulea TaxID=218851 RepID=A0A2G5D9Y1_AQUCA|nr:hypothetical protein AQUCO_02500026v1 [Aquilegia coerulea]
MLTMHRDYIQDILLRLPVKSLLRCTCLSQKWHAFISYNKSFHSSYLSRHTGYDDQVFKGFFLSKVSEYDGEEPVRFLPTSSDGRSLSVLKKRKRHHNDDADRNTYLADEDDVVTFPVDASLSFLGHDIVHVVGSSNGFLLTTLERRYPVTYMICNPLTKQHIVLPQPNLTPQFVVHGFTCDAALTNYKVVRALCFKALRYTTALTLEIFSSDLPHWRQFNSTCSVPFFLDLSLRFSAIINEGVTYLPAFLEKQTTVRPDPYILISDQSKEIVQVLEAPPSEDDASLRYYFGMSGGLTVYGYLELDQLKIWLLNDKGNGKREWSLQHKVSLKSKVVNYVECAKDAYQGHIDLIAFHPVNPQVFFLGCDQKRYQYNVKKSRLELICDLEQLGSGQEDYYFFPCTYPLIGPHLFRNR